MFIEDLKVGMKVVPVSHTVMKCANQPKMFPPTHSVVYRRALSKEPSQIYLYVIAINKETAEVLCNHENVMGGDYFQEYDLTDWEDI